MNESSAKQIEYWRGHEKFTSLEDLSRRTALTANDLQILASADVLRSISGNPHESRWRAAAIQPYSALLDSNQKSTADDLFTAAPTQAKDILDDYRTLGLTLRQHPMALLRSQPPFNKCTYYSQLANLRHKGFVRVAGLVTGHQRPGTANGTLFLTLED